MEDCSSAMSALQCGECGSLLSLPVTLPCGAAVCVGCFPVLGLPSSDTAPSLAAPSHLALHTHTPTPTTSTALPPSAALLAVPAAATVAPLLVRCPSPRCPKALHKVASKPPPIDVVAARLLATIAHKSPTAPKPADLIQDLECGLCCQLFTHPITAPCGHSFCRSCAVETVNKCSKACPFCRAKMPNSDYFRKRYIRPCNRILQTLAEWVKSCDSPSQNIPATIPQHTLRHTTSQSSLHAFLSSLPRCTPATPPTSPPTLPKNQFIIPIFVGCRTLLPGVPCYMQMFEPRYRSMMQKIIFLNNHRTPGDDCPCDSMMYGVCLRVQHESEAANTPQPEVAGIKRRRSGGVSSMTGVESESTHAPSSSSGIQSTPTSAFLGRGVFSNFLHCAPARCCVGGDASKLQSLSPWIVPGTRPGSTSEYMEFGTALKLRSVKPIYDAPPPPPPSATVSSSSAMESTPEPRHDSAMEEDFSDEEEEWGSSSGDDDAMSVRSVSNAGSRTRMVPNASSRSSGNTRRTSRSSTYSSRPTTQPATPVEPSRYLVDGIGTWRFKVLERGVCDGLNLALVQRIEDLDFEDEDVMCGGEEDDATLSGSGGGSVRGEEKEVCTLSDCDCAASRTHRAAALARKEEDNESPLTSPTTAISAFSNPTPPHRRTLTSTPDSDFYTCPVSEFFKTTRLSSFAKCVYSGARYLACTKQPAFPFDLKALAESTGSVGNPHHRQTRIAFAGAQNAYLQLLYVQLDALLRRILTYLATALLAKQESTPGYDSVLHFLLIHGAVPSDPALVTFWIVGVLVVGVGGFVVLVRAVGGGVAGRVVWVLGVVWSWEVWGRGVETGLVK
ncbi:hypothetical protein HDU98_010203, partial [Podochytrium sp. JEL0797]